MKEGERIPEEIIELLDIAVMMAQELQEYVDDACESSGDDSAAAGTQALLREWETAYNDCGLSWVNDIARADDEFHLDKLPGE